MGGGGILGCRKLSTRVAGEFAGNRLWDGFLLFQVSSDWIVSQRRPIIKSSISSIIHMHKCLLLSSRSSQHAFMKILIIIGA